MGKPGRQHRLVHASRASQRPALVAARSGPRLNEQIDHAVGRTGVESRQRPFPVDEGDVADAAQIEHGGGKRQTGPPRQGGVIDRDQRRPLTAGGHVGGAEVEGDGDPQTVGQSPGVDELNGAADRANRPRRLVHDGPTVRADEIEGVGLDAGVVKEGARGRQVLFRDRGGGGRESRRSGHSDRPASSRDDGLLDERAHGRVELLLPGGAEAANRFAVGLQNGHIDRVERGAGHEAEDAHHGHGRRGHRQGVNGAELAQPTFGRHGGT